MFGGEGEDAFLRHGALHVVVLQDHILLEYLDGVDFLGALQLRKHHLAEAALAQHLDEVEIIQAHLFATASGALHERVQCRRRFAGRGRRRFPRILHLLVQFLVHGLLGQDPQLHLFLLVRPTRAVRVAALGHGACLCHSRCGQIKREISRGRSKTR